MPPLPDLTMGDVLWALPVILVWTAIAGVIWILTKGVNKVEGNDDSSS